MLSKPLTKYPDWSRFLAAVWQDGMSVHNMNKEYAAEAVKNSSESVFESLTRRNESHVIRPSAFLSCARQSYHYLAGDEPGKMPDNIGPTFAVGHLLHEVSYAAVKSAIPDGFEVETEKAVDLPEWWVKEPTHFNQSGHVDMFISITDEKEAGKYLPEDVVHDQPKMLIDFKTMGGFSYRKHSKADYSRAVDGFGYLAQLAVYTEALGTLGSGAILAGINRDSLMQPLMPRFIAPSTLMKEVERLKRAFDSATQLQDPGPEFLIRHGAEANFYCGRGGKPGYCPFKKACKAMG
jgi:hypothetical protein